MQQTLLDPLSKDALFQEIRHHIDTPGNCARVTEASDAGRLFLASALAAEYPCTLIITYSDLRAKEILEDYRFYDKEVMYYPAKDLIFYQADVHGNEVIRQRMKCLQKLSEGGRVTIVTSFAALMEPMALKKTPETYRIDIAKGETLSLKECAASLVTFGYDRVHQVAGPGEFAIRGDILDIFPLTAENPVRVELWGDDVDSVRSFDLLSQRSIEQKERVRILPATETVFTKEELLSGMERIEADATAAENALRDAFETEAAHRLKTMVEELKEQLFTLQMSVNLDSYIRYFVDDPATLCDLFPKEKTILFFDEPERIKHHALAVEEEFKESMAHRATQGMALKGQMALLSGTEALAAKTAAYRRVLMENIPLSKEGDIFDADEEKTRAVSFPSAGIAPYNNSFDALVRDLKKYKKEHYRVLIVSGSRARVTRLTEALYDNGVQAFASEDPNRVLSSGEIMTRYGMLKRGFACPGMKFAVISESDIFTARTAKKRRKKKFHGEAISDFADLKVGDYVVHEDHGLGIYKGIEKIVTDGAAKDYIKIEYDGGGNLYVQASALSVIGKYASPKGGDDEKTERKVKLNRLGTSEWSRTKAKTKEAVDEVARDLVELYAVRRQKQGFAFTQDTVWQQEFEEAFPYEETDDQADAIAAMKEDMESSRIMDRLICGDVGFGKTEIAIRGAFKAVQDSKQVAVLVPTTILAQQHYNTFTDRMKDFPVRIEMLSRFRTAKEQKKVVADLEKGLVDIVIGTHRLLSLDVTYKDLGLLVVDEEQRFGVAHKEKIKKLKDTVDVLTLSATPIPRTLHMSLVGIRDMSLLEEAPNDRLPIQTYVSEYNDEIVREAIVRELARGGQIYYVYNRVNTIDRISAKIKELVPQARVAYAHGQMAEAALERIMYEFIAGDIDVLVSTTIIETGLDIPNVNTMIIHDSDKMGLAQLYQLRGRVGRSNRTAYAFLMYKRDKLLKEVAEKRLSAIREFTDLGSGYKIAMRDLEIRGAGNLLGKRQSGHMYAVGYDLYCKMLEEAVGRLTGKTAPKTTACRTNIDLNVNAFIPAEYILNEEQKLEIYKRIAVIANEEEASDMRDELKDRFGAVPKEIDHLIKISLLREAAARNDVAEVKGVHGEVRIILREDARVDITGIPAVVSAFGGSLQFHGAGKPMFVLKAGRLQGDEDLEETLLSGTKRVLDLMQAKMPRIV